MHIKEAEIFSFGKLKGKKICFEPGINVIYGANEAGKSTLHAFLVAMLFGMEKGRGKAPLTEGYRRYEPWDAPAYYSGALRFEVDGRPFYLERNFYHKEKREILRNEADGEELSVAYGDLTMLLGGIHKETFGNTFDIPQSGAVTGKELADALTEYLSDAAESGNSGFRVTRALEILREKKKKLNAEKKNLLNEKEQRSAALKIEQRLLQNDCEKLRKDIVTAQQRMADTGVETKERETSAGKENYDGRGNAKKAMQRGMVMLVLAVLLVFGMALTLYISKNIPYTGTFLWSMAGVFGTAAFIFALLGGVICQQAKKQNMPLQKDRETEGLQEQEKQGQELTRADEVVALLQESLSEKETRLYNIGEQLEQFGTQTYREIELQQEIDAVTLAAAEIEQLAKEFCEEAGDGLNEAVSRYVSAITGGRYDSVRVDEDGKLWVQTCGREVSPEALSRGTLEQFYLALRLAVGETVMWDEVMPIFLDDAFVSYDDDRLRQTLKMLSEMDTQILLFTCQKREAMMLSEMGKDYQLINL